MLDAKASFPGWARTGVEFAAYARRRRRRGRGAGVPVLRHAGHRSELAFLHGRRDECAFVKQNPDWIYEAIAFYIDVPQNRHQQLPRRDAAVYRSFHPGARQARLESPLPGRPDDAREHGGRLDCSKAS